MVAKDQKGKWWSNGVALNSLPQSTTQILSYLSPGKNNLVDVRAVASYSGYASDGLGVIHELYVAYEVKTSSLKGTYFAASPWSVTERSTTAASTECPLRVSAWGVILPDAVRAAILVFLGWLGLLVFWIASLSLKNQYSRKIRNVRLASFLAGQNRWFGLDEAPHLMTPRMVYYIALVFAQPPGHSNSSFRAWRGSKKSTEGGAGKDGAEQGKRNGSVAQKVDARSSGCFSARGNLGCTS